MPKLACLLPLGSQYDSVHYFSRSLAKAFKQRGLDVNLFDPQQKELGRRIREYQADALICFNNFYRDPEDVMLCDRLGIPCFAFLVDGPQHFIPFTSSPLLHLSCVDQRDSRFFAEELQFSQTQFLPHAIDASLCEEPVREPLFPISFFGTSIDYLGIQQRWRQQLPGEDVEILETVIERCQEDRSLAYFDALSEELIKHGYEEELEDINSLFIATLWNLIDLYLRGRDRVELIQALADFPVHVFGQGLGRSSWEKVLDPLPENVIVHPAQPFEKALELMRQSQLVLNPFPTFRSGMHERVLYGMASGAVLVADSNPYLESQFLHGEELVLYQPENWDPLKETVTKLLSDEDLRLNMARSGRLAVKKSHTWDQRVDDILKSLVISC